MDLSALIPTDGLKKVGDEIVDRAKAAVDSEVGNVRSQIEAVLSEWEVVVSFRKKT